MTEFSAKAVVESINRMFASHHFSICTVDECMKVTGAVRTSDYPALKLYHCVNYSDMTRDTKDWVFRVTVENVSNVDDFPKLELAKKSDEITTALTLQSNRQSIWKRMLGVA